MIKKYLFFLSVVILGFSFTAFGQNEQFHLSNPELLTCKLIRISPPLNMIPQDNPPKGRKRPLYGDGEEEEGQIKLHKPVNAANALPKGVDPALQKVYHYRDSNSRTPTGLGLQFAGLGYTGVNPSDNNLASGTNHIVQMINNSSSSLVRIWNKTGTVLVNSIQLSTITGHGGFGDPIVLYDQLADRYLLAEFGSSGNHIYICVSQTNDPTGAYFVYDFTTPQFPDYFKIAAWGNSYIVTSNENSPAVYAMDRTKMLAGTPTSTVQRFTVPSYPTITFQALTPVDLSGTAQPAGSPALLMRMADDAWTTGIVDRLEIFSFNIDWVTPANTTLTGPDLLPTLPFSTNFCGYTTFSCIPQQGSSTKLDPLREVLMNKSYYRNFGTYESIVCNHVTDIDGTSHAGVRWYELRKTPPSTSWVIYQQGTYAPPGTLHRWMACIAINGNGDIGLGYNIAGTTFPTMAYTGRRACDPLGTMTEPETIVIAGTSPNGSNRWGDYNGMTVDPVDGSFWFTTNYNATTQWATRVANFSLPACGCTPASISTHPSNTITCTGNNASLTVVAAGTGPLSYQWQESAAGCGGPWNNIGNAGVYTGATTATLTITGATAGMNNYGYRCIVTGNCAPLTATSNCALLTVNAITAVSGQPVNSTICANANASFTITATGSSLAYQWQVSTDAGTTFSNITNSSLYSGTTSATLVITGATVVMNTYKYRCLVSGTCAPAVTTGIASLTVYTPISITTSPANSNICATGTTSFTLVAAGTGPTYQWQESTNSGGTWSNITNGGIYSGAATATLTLTGLIPSMNNNQYRCVVAGTAPCSAINSTGATLTVSPQPTVTLTASPYIKLLPWYSTVITATVNPPAGFTTLWTRNGNPVTPINNTYSVNVDRLGTYTVVATIGTCISVPASITIGDSASSKLWIFPSPTSGQFTISYYNPGGGATTQMVNIYDAMGRRAYSNIVAVSQAYQLIQVDMRRNSAGVYRVVMRDSAGRKVKTGTVEIR